MKLINKIKCHIRGYHIERIEYLHDGRPFAYMACKDCGEYFGGPGGKYRELVKQGKIIVPKLKGMKER